MVHILPQGRSPFWPIMAMVILLIAQATMVFTRAINWDEFFYYSQVHQYLRGEPLAPLQTIHVHLFAWLSTVQSNPVDAIVVARIFMLGCEIVTIGSIVLIGERFADRTTGAIAGLCYLSAGFVLQHGFSFRVDPPTTALLMVSLALLARSRLGAVAIGLFAVCVAMAGMFTIKIVLFAPAFAGLAWWRWCEDGRSRAMALRLLACGVCTLLLFAAFYFGHSAALAANVSSAEVSGRGKTVVQSAGEAVFFLGLPPYLQMMQKAVSITLAFTALIVLAPFVIWRARIDSGSKVALTGLWLPILTLFFYRNTAPYYYAFMLAPVAAGCVLAIARVERRVAPAFITLSLALLALPVVLGEDRHTIANQRIVVGEASRMFAWPTAYFDHNGALAGHVKANGFMTPWGLEGYRDKGQSMFRLIMQRQTVPLLFENDLLLAALLRGERGADELFPDDSQVLRDNYVRVWGPVWLAGKDIPAGSERVSEILVPGRFRVEGGPVAVGGKVLEPGDTVALPRGNVTLSNPGTGASRLVWADVDRMPQQPAPEGRIWIGF